MFVIIIQKLNEKYNYNCVTFILQEDLIVVYYVFPIVLLKVFF